MDVACGVLQAAAKQDEDDLDALLAELGEGPAAAAPQTATAESQPADTAAEADADTAADGAEDDAADTAVSDALFFNDRHDRLSKMAVCLLTMLS